MNLGERCDEIVRLIDETLAGLAVDDDSASESGDTPTLRAPATVTSLPPHPGRGGVRRRGAA